MATSAYLPMNSPATITIKIDAVFMPSADKIKAILTKELPTAAYINTVDRSYFSSNYAITFTPRNSRTSDNWGQTFLAALEKNGYSGTVLVIEAGTESSMEGGLMGGTKQLIGDVAAPLTAPVQEVGSTLKWVAAGAIALAMIVYLPAFSSIGSGIKKGLGGK